MLTAQQRRAFDFIEASIAASGVAPSLTEIQMHLGLQGKAGAFRILTGLEERGFIRRLKNRARAIEVLKPSRPLPAGAPPPVASLPAAARMLLELIPDDRRPDRGPGAEALHGAARAGSISLLQAHVTVRAFLARMAGVEP